MSAVSWRGLAKASPVAARDAVLTLAGLLAFVSACSFVQWGISNGVLGYDFQGTLWDAGLAIRDGRSPYPAPVATEVEVGNPVLYPPLLLLLTMPLTVLPWWAGVAVWTVALTVGVGGSLYLLGVRDPRCYALALISAPTVIGLVWGNASLLLLPLVALAWHWRDSRRKVGTVVGLAIAAKFFLWPLLFWLLGTRRYRASATAAVVTVAGLLVPWALIGFDGFVAYPDLLEVAEDVYAVHGYSVATMLSALGVSTDGASWGSLGTGLVLAGVALLVARSGRDQISFTIAVLAAILGSPIVWDHYYVLLLAPLAIARPRFSALWLLPALFYVTHRLPRPRLLAHELDPGGVACCKPSEVPLSSWVMSHAPPGLWPAVGHAALAATIVGVTAWMGLRSSPARADR